jgi:hypothetical protein
MGATLKTTSSMMIQDFAQERGQNCLNAQVD